MALYLEDYLDSIENLPQEIHQNLSYMKMKDKAFHEWKDAWMEKQALFLKSTKKVSKTLAYETLLKKAKEDYPKALEMMEDKVSMASQTYEMMDQNIKRLEREMHKLMELMEKEKLHHIGVGGTTAMTLLGAENYAMDLKLQMKRNHSSSLLNQRTLMMIGQEGDQGSGSEYSPLLGKKQAWLSLGDGESESTADKEMKDGVGGRLDGKRKRHGLNRDELVQLTGGDRNGYRKSLKLSHHRKETYFQGGPTEDENHEGEDERYNSEDEEEQSERRERMTKRPSQKLAPITSVTASPSCVFSSRSPLERDSSFLLNDEEIYCICRQVSYGDMVACDNPNCSIEWFHYSCVGLIAPPKGQWYCPECSAALSSDSSSLSTSHSTPHSSSAGRKRRHRP